MAVTMANDIYRTLALRLRERRRRSGLTLEKLGEHAGITGAFVAHIEAGRKRPTLDTVAKLAQALGTTVSGLLQEEPHLNGNRVFVEQFTNCLIDLSIDQSQALIDLCRAAKRLAGPARKRR